MHAEPNPLVAELIRLIVWAEEGAAAQRFIWEVCRWPKGHAWSWAFVCWMIDGDGMWMQPFPSKQAAMARFEQAPSVVMALSSQSVDGNPIRGVKLRRAS